MDIAVHPVKKISLMRARVYKSTGSWYTVKTEDGHFSMARIKGIFKIDGITSTNPIAVGDWVNIEIESGGEEGGMMITGIDERNNYINRQSPANKHQHHIIASNLNQSLLLATLMVEGARTGARRLPHRMAANTRPIAPPRPA